MESQQPLREFIFDQEIFDCEMLGLYKVGQEFKRYYISKPKPFNLKIDIEQ